MKWDRHMMAERKRKESHTPKTGQFQELRFWFVPTQTGVPYDFSLHPSAYNCLTYNSWVWLIWKPLVWWGKESMVKLRTHPRPDSDIWASSLTSSHLRFLPLWDSSCSPLLSQENSHEGGMRHEQTSHGNEDIHITMGSVFFKDIRKSSRNNDNLLYEN